MTAPDRVELNGEPASVDDLRVLVQTNYGHFSAMRAEDGGVRGLDLHLARLDAATRELFGTALDPERVRGYLRHALAGSDKPVALRVNVFSRALDRDQLASSVAADVLVIASSARPAALAPLRVKSFVYGRDSVAIKHVGTFPLFAHRRRAQLAGFDDALFVDAAGAISEGSIWNVGFVGADGIVWPDAPQLDGISMQLLKRGLARLGIASTTRAVTLADLAGYRAAFFTNASVPVRAISCIDAQAFAGEDATFAMLSAAYASNPPQAI